MKFHKHDLYKLYNRLTEENSGLTMQELRDAAGDFFEKKEPTSPPAFLSTSSYEMKRFGREVGIRFNLYQNRGRLAVPDGGTGFGR
ncbi:hypothetical protein [Pontibacter pamirensis]|uniref:hypothetical protein n=1 Tax=Pontibacter pamirensis TaxID=2562824 RepID=UPI00138A6517|nr:hypothetical protein [Pontibacter pamirensis]